MSRNLKYKEKENFQLPAIEDIDYNRKEVPGVTTPQFDWNSAIGGFGKPVLAISPSDDLQDEGGGSGTPSGTVYQKLKEIRFNELSGTIRVGFTIVDNNGAGDTNVRIYVNDVAVGTPRQIGTTTPADYTEDIAVESGDLVQIYGYTDNSGGGAGGSVSNFNLYYSKTIAISSPGVIIQ